MDPITIKGIKLQSLSVDLTDERKISASYALVSSLDKVLAKQSIGGYGGMELNLSPDTQQKLNAFLRAYKNDVNSTLGLPTE